VEDAPKAEPEAKADASQSKEAAAPKTVLEAPKSTAAGYDAGADPKPVAAEASKRSAAASATQAAAASAAAPVAAPEAPKPCLHYFPFAGRGELTRLIAAVGALAIDEKQELADREAFGSPGQWPCLEHGQLRVAQSFCIETYFASIVPGFKDLTPAQQAVDSMFCKIKEDMLAGYVETLSFIMEDESKKAEGAEDIAEHSDKWFPILESRLPAVGFINGLSLPTAADLVVLNVIRGFMPFGAAYALSGYDVSAKFPNLLAHADRVAAYPAVKAYLDRSKTMDADPLGLRTSQASPSSPFVSYHAANFKGAQQVESLARDLFGARV
jgi:glutathione S-transferase